MKNTFKPLGIAAAVAAASAGYANVASAAAVANNALGDLALVPYYTVEGDFVTGVHVVNTSDKTQVVKFRLRRAEDSLDALDFNIIMSPEDVWAGFISADEEGTISFTANDTTCSAPQVSGGKFVMPDLYNPNGEASTGYIEVIAMGATIDEDQPIAVAAKHADGEPDDCAAVASNFFSNSGDLSKKGVIDKDTTHGIYDGDLEPSEYEDAGNVLKVSFFIRDAAGGVEFGNNAVHVQDFLDAPAMTNQELGYLSGDLRGFDFPDLNGGSPLDPADRGKFNTIRGGDVLGVAALINEWSSNPVNGVSTDWVVTMPGQYTMLDMPDYLASLVDPDEDCLPDVCDFRDIPVVANVSAYDREEGRPTAAPGELVVSPSLPGQPNVTRLPKEVNVVTFGGNEENGVLGVSDVDINAGLDQPFGWLSLGVTSAADRTQMVCEWVLSEEDPMECTEMATGNVPMIGFTAWERNFANNPAANYGRIIEHSFVPGSAE